MYTESKGKEDVLFNTFFEGSHMNIGDFDSVFEAKVTEQYNDIVSETINTALQDVSIDATLASEEHHLNHMVTLREVVDAIAHQKASVKSFDDDDFHPSIIKRLPTNAIEVLCKIFNLCLSLGVWVWDVANVVFIRKEGKPNYMKAGAYRPISISSYFGKLYERILERRIRYHCDLEDILDDEQEGFRSCRNTTRYLYKLTASLKAAQQRNFTSFLLCLDFEKAFDSVWLKGLIVKLFTLNIKGNILRVIDSFLFSRKVKLIINKCQGKARKCGNYGVPQGSVLSPLLFIIYIGDMFKQSLTSPNCRESATVYKYADDGSIAITHEKPDRCHNIAQQMCDHLTQWCRKWRLKINCDKNKTECLIIQSTSRNQSMACTFQKLKINGKEINYVEQTTVLGVVIDNKLNFNKHANKKLQQCWFTWYKLTKNCTRFRGLNVSSLVILFKTVVLTKLMYAAPVWLKDNFKTFRSFYARVCLKISGSTHYPSQSLTLLAMGLEPLQVLYEVISTKFVLKALHSDPNMRSMMLQIECSRNHPFYHHISLVRKYLLYKDSNLRPVHSREHQIQLSRVSDSLTYYLKSEIEGYKMKLWKESLVSGRDEKLLYLLNLTDFSSTEFQPRNHKILFPRTSRRSTDTKVMDLIHGHSLTFGSFKCTIGRRDHHNCTMCGSEDHNFHQLMECPKFNCSYREHMVNLCRSPCIISIFLSIILEADRYQVECFRNMAQIIVNN